MADYESKGQTWWLHIDVDGRIVSTAATRGQLRVLRPREAEGERVILVAEVQAMESQSKADQITLTREEAKAAAWGIGRQVLDGAALDVARKLGSFLASPGATESKSVGDEAGPIGLRAHLDAAFSLASIAAAPDIMDCIGDAIAIMDGDQDPAPATECKSYGRDIHPECAETLAEHAESEAEWYERYARHADPRDAASLKGKAIRWRKVAASLRTTECRSVADAAEGELIEALASRGWMLSQHKIPVGYDGDEYMTVRKLVHRDDPRDRGGS